MAAAALAGLGLLVRVIYVMAAGARTLPFTDALWYQFESGVVSHGHGFVNPFDLAFQHHVVPTAAHPPLYVLFLAAGNLLGAKSVVAHELMGCGVGTMTVIACGVVGAFLGDDATGLMAMAVAAVYPGLWVTDGGIMSEGLFALLVTLAVIAACRYDRSRSVGAAVVLGVTIGLAVLTRENADLLLVVLCLPLVATGPRISLGRRFTRLAAMGLGAAIVVSPWVIRNLVTFDRPVIISTGNGTLLGANCRPTYYGPDIGTWQIGCYSGLNVAPGADESIANDDAEHAGVDFVEHHISRVPVVVAARIGRVWQVYQPAAGADNNRDDGRSLWAASVTMWGYFALAPLALAGAVILVRRRRLVLPLLAPLAAVTLTAALVWGSVRFRATAEPVLAVLAAVALVALLRRRDRNVTT